MSISNTPNGGMLQTDVVTLQSAILQIKSLIQYIILNMERISQLDLIKELKKVEEITTTAIFSAKYEGTAVDNIQQEKLKLKLGLEQEQENGVPADATPSL